MLLWVFLMVLGGKTVAASDESLKIGIISADKIGDTLGELWAKAGHRVSQSSRHPQRLKALAERIGPSAQYGFPQGASIPYGALHPLNLE